MNLKVMAHEVAFYPTGEESFLVAKALIDGGASYLEVQFPFSDPSADGPVIEEACTQALGEGFELERGFHLVERIKNYSDIPVFVMSYASPVCAKGIDYFIAGLKHSGASGIIVPDLPPGYDEGLFDAGAKAGIAVVPVVAPSLLDGRLHLLEKLRPEYLYVALRSGITGSHTELGAEQKAFLERMRPLGAKMLAGFGIHSRRQIESLAGNVHAVVIGSAFVREIQRAIHEAGSVYDFVLEKAKELISSY